MGVGERCRFLQAAADDLDPIGEASVDIVTTRSVLIYVKDKAAAFREFHRVLRRGGRLSIYEPINQLMVAPGCLFGHLGHDSLPIADLEAKLETLYASIQDPETDPMVDFDEQDLLALAEEAGFEEVHLELRVDVAPGSHGLPWETFVNSSGNPLVPTLREAIDQALTPEEAARLEFHLRPLVEQGRGRRRLAAAYLWATKDAARINAGSARC